MNTFMTNQNDQIILIYFTKWADHKQLDVIMLAPSIENKITKRFACKQRKEKKTNRSYIWTYFIFPIKTKHRPMRKSL